MNHPTDRIAHTMVFDTPVMELERDRVTLLKKTHLSS